MALQFTDANFKQEVLDKPGLSVIDFWAEWCGPCKMIAPIIEELSGEYKNKVTIGKMDVDSNQEIPFKYQIRSIPTILFIKGGEIVDKHVGYANKSALEQKIIKHLN